jgi:uncharacterized protein YdaU (DUF1376 family)
MPLYIANYLGDTMHLTTRQHGGYLLLIMAYWRNAGPLPADDRRLAAICRLHISEWAEDRDTLSEFFDVDADLWHHKRIDLELANALDNVQKASEKGKAGAAKRWLKDAAGNTTGNAPAIPQAMPEPMLGQCSGNASLPSPLPITTDVVIKKHTPLALLSQVDGLSDQVAQDFLKVRKAKKAPLTATALALIELEAHKAGITTASAIAIATARGWQSFKAEWVSDNKHKSMADRMAEATYGPLLENGGMLP